MVLNASTGTGSSASFSTSRLKFLSEASLASFTLVDCFKDNSISELMVGEVLRNWDDSQGTSGKMNRWRKERGVLVVIDLDDLKPAVFLETNYFNLTGLLFR